MLPGGPVAIVGFTQPNDDFWVAQFLEVWREEISQAHVTTLGDMVRRTKSRLANEPQSQRSALLMQHYQGAGMIALNLKTSDCQAIARKNNALLVLFGDPTTTVVIP